MTGATGPQPTGADAAAAAPPAPGGSAQRTVRRLIVYTLLAVLVTIAAIGVAGLLERLLDRAEPLAGSGTTDLALSLAFTFIGGPLAAVLWWSVWRRLADESERTSLAWGLYLTVVPTYVGGFMALSWAGDKRLGTPAGIKSAQRRYAKAKLKTDYYNPEIHAASFAFPEWVKRLIPKDKSRR